MRTSPRPLESRTAIGARRSATLAIPDGDRLAMHGQLGIVAAMACLAVVGRHLGMATVAVQSSMLALVALLPIASAWRAKRLASRIGLCVILVFYALNFAVRALYAVFEPSTLLYPNVSFPADADALTVAQVWCGAGLSGLSIGYLLSAKAYGRLRSTQSIRATLEEAFTPLNTRWFLIAAYAIGTIARINAIRTGSNLWLYNSPSFDMFASRAGKSVAGVYSFAGDFPLIVWGIALAGFLAEPAMRRVRSARILLVAGGVVEALYSTYALHKYGLIALLLILVSVGAYRGRLRTTWVLGSAAIMMFLVFPFMNVARDQLLPYYKSGAFDMRAWLSVADGARHEATAEGHQTGVRGAADAVFARLNGVEALVVAQKYYDLAPVERGKTYENLLWQLLPGAGRPAEWTPYYFDWAVTYAGLEPWNFTVIPVPAVVEAFLNFGWIGPPIVLGFFGAILALVDGLGVSLRAGSAAAGIAAYSLSKMANVEHYLFVSCVALIKLWVLIGMLHVARLVVSRTRAGQR